ncbi:MAG: toprim domain-containing protein, partial [Synergistaceae bacterium]|nr:toprim domain-containing protein [Synergistaceae bacterium]
FAKMRVGTMRLFNEAALKQEESPVFIVEGEIDALSLIDAGGQAVGLCSIANIGKLIEAVKKEPPKVPLIILLDSDERGQGATLKLIEWLNKINFPFYRQSVLPKPYKDANEFLMSDRQKFTEWVTSEMNNANIEQMREDVEQKEQEEREAFRQESVSYYLDDFFQEVKRNREGQAISTGFENFDNIFGGGLYPGLYTLGANSSIGKTTLILQIADNMAERGQGVLIFSLEMSRNELIAKSLSRLSFQKSCELYHSSKYAKTTRGILRGDYSTDENEFLGSCADDYDTYSENIFISEGVGDVGVEQIRDKTEKYIKYNNTPPVIVIDYLQIISPYNLKFTDKQNTDKNILELKRLSRDLQIPIIGISSFNRESYKSPVSMASFKESGAIEYSSDVLIGLQFEGWDYTIRDTSDKVRQERLSNLLRVNEEKAKAGQAQRIQAKILKNRNGGRGSVYFEFFPMFNYFRPREGKTLE